MIKLKLVICFGRWNHKASAKYLYNRVWFRGYVWTPFCLRQPRYEGYNSELWK